jgi:peptidoglycan hydrolase-like protein with peptidoglycan-binding domain
MAKNKFLFLKVVLSFLLLSMILRFVVYALEVKSELKVPNCESNRILQLKDPLMTGYDVIELEERMIELGVYSGPAFGVYDHRLAQAVAAFQGSKRLEPNGIVGPETWSALAGEDSEDRPTNAKPRPKGKITIKIHVNSRTLTVYSDGEVYKRYPIAVGKASTPTPIGEWKIVHRSTGWGGGFGTRWLGLNVPWGIYGIHGTNKPWSIGRAESHGCIRMHNQDVEELFSWITVGTEVDIIGDISHIQVKDNLSPGRTGKDVVVFQMILREAGFNPGRADGRYGQQTIDAIKSLQRYYSLPVTGIAGPDEFILLNLK